MPAQHGQQRNRTAPRAINPSATECRSEATALWLETVERRAAEELDATGLSDQQLKQPASLRFLIMHSAAHSEAVQLALQSRDRVISQLVKRIDRLEAGGTHG